MYIWVGAPVYAMATSKEFYHCDDNILQRKVSINKWFYLLTKCCPWTYSALRHFTMGYSQCYLLNCLKPTEAKYYKLYCSKQIDFWKKYPAELKMRIYSQCNSVKLYLDYRMKLVWVEVIFLNRLICYLNRIYCFQWC